MRTLAVLVAGLALMLVAGTGHAHSRSQSFSTWTVEQSTRLTGVYTIDSRRATLLYANAPAGDPLPLVLAAHLAGTVSVSQGENLCEALEPPRPQPANPGFMRVRLDFECPRAITEAGAVLHVKALFDYAASHAHVARVEIDGQRSRQSVLSPSHTRLVIAGKAEPAATWRDDLWRFVTLGVGHVLSGFDHLAFLLALILLTRGWRELVWTVTAFTLGHSITLGLTVLGVLQPMGSAIEALIGFSIVYAALEAARRRQMIDASAIVIATLALGLGGLLAWSGGWLDQPLLLLFACVLMLPAAGYGSAEAAAWRAPLVASGFGLIHGAGFAGFLLELQLPADNLAIALFGFNLGVEIGQLMAIAAVFSLWALVGSQLRARLLIARPVLPAVLVATGVFWLAERSLSLQAL